MKCKLPSPRVMLWLGLLAPNAWPGAAQGQAKDPEVLEAGKNGILAVAISPDDKTLAAGGYPGPHWRWDLGTNKELPRFPGTEPMHARAIAFTPDGQTLIVAGHGKIYLHQAPERK